jgi:hypothetical protein
VFDGLGTLNLCGRWRREREAYGASDQQAFRDLIEQPKAHYHGSSFVSVLARQIETGRLPSGG